MAQVDNLILNLFVARCQEVLWDRETGRWKKGRAFSLSSLLRLFKVKTHRDGNYKRGTKKMYFILTLGDGVVL
jgi:hypothetical protein